MFNPIQATALAAVETLVNQALRFDPASQQSLGQLEGKVIAIECLFPPITFFIQPHSKGLRLCTDFEGTPDTTLKGSAVALATLAANTHKTSLYDSGATVAGDQTLLQTLSAILQNLDIDWEAALAKLFGDVPAHLMGEAIRSTVTWQKETAARAATVAAEFSVEEAQWLPNHYEVDVFNQQVNQLRQDVDRMAARVDKLKQRLTDTEDD